MARNVSEDRVWVSEITGCKIWCLDRQGRVIRTIGTGRAGFRPGTVPAAEDACTVVADDVFRFLSRASEPADLALADPPYGQGDASRLVELFVKEPFAKELWLEHPSRESLLLPPDARTRRYGDTALTTLTS